VVSSDAKVAGAVLATNELLENILQEFDMTELLEARQVSRQWRAVIDRGTAVTGTNCADTEKKYPPLQQTLFLAPICKSSSYSKWSGGRDPKVIQLPKADADSEAYTWSEVSTIVNPLLFKLDPYELSEDLVRTFESRRDDVSNVYMLHGDRDFYYEGPLAQMYVTQPPVQQIDMFWQKGHRTFREVTVENPLGLTVGDVLASARSFFARGWSYTEREYGKIRLQVPVDRMLWIDSEETWRLGVGENIVFKKLDVENLGHIWREGSGLDEDIEAATRAYWNATKGSESESGTEST
jgi:hypothetical protein